VLYCSLVVVSHAHTHTHTHTENSDVFSFQELCTDEVMVVDEWRSNGPQDLVTVSQNAFNKMHPCSLSIRGGINIKWHGIWCTEDNGTCHYAYWHTWWYIWYPLACSGHWHVSMTLLWYIDTDIVVEHVTVLPVVTDIFIKQSFSFSLLHAFQVQRPVWCQPVHLHDATQMRASNFGSVYIKEYVIL